MELRAHARLRYGPAVRALLRRADASSRSEACYAWYR